jgi:energy-coupling factor transporter ATP-binding protein EcfA2
VKKSKKHETPAGLKVAGFARAKKLDPAWLKKLSITDAAFGGIAAVRIPYGSEDGYETAVRFRLAMKGPGRFRWEKGSKPTLFGLWRLKTMVAKGFVVLDEGESDTLTLWSQKIPALGLPGAASWREEWAKYFRDFKKIFVIIEPDRGGETVLRWLSTSSIRDRVSLVRLKGAKDPSELYLKDPPGFKRAFQKALDEAEPWSDKGQPKPDASDSNQDGSQATRLANLVTVPDLFHADDRPYATVTVAGHRENWAINSQRFKQWLTRTHYEKEKEIPNTQAITEALNVIGGKALFDGREAPVFTRVAGHDGKIYVDLADPAWRAVEISADGWHLVTEPPVRFRRSRGMLALPEPVSGGDVNELASYVNFGSDDDKLLASSWLVTALRPQGPYPILALHGEQGSGKSTAARILRSLIDPSTASVRSAPRDVRDLMISATNSHVISLDNMSHLEPWLSDALCRLSTGGGLSTRQLFTDDEEVVFNAMRPQLLNGIGEVTARGDLMERTVLLYLPAIDEDRRESEEDFWRHFEKARPRILGGLFTAAAAALREYPSVKLEELPRMADFAKWATAAEPTLGAKSGAFAKAYARNRRNANDVVLESSPLAALVMKLAAQEEGWKGTASELLDELISSRGSDHSHGSLPKSANGLSASLKRLAPNLRTNGIGVYFNRESGTGRRIVSIKAIE